MLQSLFQTLNFGEQERSRHDSVTWSLGHRRQQHTGGEIGWVWTQNLLSALAWPADPRVHAGVHKQLVFVNTEHSITGFVNGLWRRAVSWLCCLSWCWKNTIIWRGGGLRRVLVKGYRCDTRSYECVLWFYAMQIKPKPRLFAQMVTK